MTQAPHQPGSAHATGPAIMGVGDVLRILKKRVWLIVACIVVLGLGGTGGLFVWWYFWPYYTAEGILRVIPYQGQVRGQEMLPPEYQEIIVYQLYEQKMMGEVIQIEGEGVLRGALQELAGQQRMYGPNETEGLQEDLEVSYIPRSQNIAVRLTGRSPEDVRNIVQEVMETYIDVIRNQHRSQDAVKKDDLSRERDSLQAEAERLTRTLQRFLEQENTVKLGQVGSEEHNRLIALSRQLVATEANLAAEKAAWEHYQRLVQQAEEEQNQAALFLAYPDIHQQLQTNRTLSGLDLQVATLQRDLESLSQRLGPNHQSVKRVEKSLQLAQNRRDAEMQRTLAELIEQQGGVLRARYEQARQAVADLRDQVSEARSEASRMERRASELANVQRQYERVQEQLDAIDAGLGRLDIQSALSLPNVRIVQPAVTPLDPSEPKLLLYIPLVLVFSIAVGAGLSLLLEFMDAKIRTPAQIARQVGVPILGSVPDLAEDERLDLDTHVCHVSQKAPQSLLAEAFRQFRTNLRFASDASLRSVLITSPNPGDGKTVTAINLATAMARSGTRVLLIEGNFRRPHLAQCFDVPDQVGLSNVLVELNSLDEAVQASRIENLDVLPGGPPPPSPGDLLGSAKMRSLLEEAGKQYDQVIIDAAPILVVADAHLLATAVDGVVLVYRAGENTRGLAQRAARQVLELKARLLGGVLNGVRATRGGYFREVYQAYYDYSGVGPGAVVSRATPGRAAAEPEAPGAEETPVAAPAQVTEADLLDEAEDVLEGISDQLDEPPPSRGDSSDDREP